jgi:mRNA-degrading endonuclease toxin of MazEF toxin-antitoxin module
MHSSPPALRYGRIVYAWIEDHRGHAKLRPALVLTPDSEITPRDSISVAAITTTFTDPPPSLCVQLLWHPAGRVGTSLKRRSAAVCNWLATIQPADVVGYGGDVPARVMVEIQRKIAELPEA